MNTTKYVVQYMDAWGNWRDTPGQRDTLDSAKLLLWQHKRTDRFVSFRIVQRTVAETVIPTD